jgi:hypothetical protein
MACDNICWIRKLSSANGLLPFSFYSWLHPFLFLCCILAHMVSLFLLNIFVLWIDWLTVDILKCLKTYIELMFMSSFDWTSSLTYCRPCVTSWLYVQFPDTFSVLKLLNKGMFLLMFLWCNWCVVIHLGFFLLADGLIMFQGVMFYNTGFICEVPQHRIHIGNISYSACLHWRPYIIVQYISFSFVPHLLFSLIYAY